MTTPEQEIRTTEMVYGADNDALKFIFQVKTEALRQFQNKLITLRKEQKPGTNVCAIQSLLFACRTARADANSAFKQIESNERFIEEMRQLWENCPFSMPEETIK
ncbi:hypothetical protein [Aeromonas hydrophila]|uniref:Uncharacterized protein n=1 Tax=Aeromonas hydrophila TaxID=644 RepID=A0AAX3P700_AERHY|nr:hypothetical protein [Aeromonas hydrophila]WEE25221.1 hypothetical protein PY771_16360 [Aeromonas hydrophila]